jgi:pyridoxamine 5'-phosphate oxidase
MLRDWLDPLRQSLECEYGQRPRPVTLATNGRDGDPRARTVVCREIDAEGRFYFVSDRRSHKNFELRLRFEAELVFWLPSQRLQYRLRGNALVRGGGDGPELVERLWPSLSDETRATFFWPAPGEPFDPSAEFARAAGADVPPPENFEVIVFQPLLVERLDLHPHPHDRRRWREAEEWCEQRLNP